MRGVGGKSARDGLKRTAVVECSQLGEEHAERPRIRDDVMRDHPQKMFLLRNPHEAHAQQASRFEIERRLGKVAQKRPRALLALLARQGTQIVQRDGHGRRRQHDLHRLSAVPIECRPQRIVPNRQRIERVRKPGRVERAAQA